MGKLHVHCQEKITYHSISSEEQWWAQDVRFSVLFMVSSKFPMKRALTKAWQDVLTLVNQCKGWVADYVAIIDVWFSSNACKKLLLL